MITRINESKTLTKHISFECGIMINVDASAKTFMCVKKIIFGIPLHVLVKMENIYQVL